MIDVDMRIKDIEKGLTFDVNNVELTVYYGFFNNKRLDTIVRFEYISDENKFVLYEFNYNVETNYSYIIDENNERVFNCSVNLKLPRTLFDKNFDYFSVGCYFYISDDNYTDPGLGIYTLLKYELSGDNIKITKRRSA